MADAQRQAKEWASEAEKNSGGLSRLQDEVGGEMAGGWELPNVLGLKVIASFFFF